MLFFGTKLETGTMFVNLMHRRITSANLRVVHQPVQFQVIDKILQQIAHILRASQARNWSQACIIRASAKGPEGGGGSDIWPTPDHPGEV